MEALIYQKRMAELREEKEKVAVEKVLSDLTREKFKKEVAELKGKEKEIAKAIEVTKILAITK